MRHYEAFATWDELLDHVHAQRHVFYLAPMDSAPRSVLVERMYKNGKVRINPLSNQADKFTADAGHLDRFRREDVAP